MKEQLELREIFGAKPETIYQAWLNSELHSEMTGGEAICGSNIGDPYTAWDDYISGKNIVLETNEKIVQSWRTTEFKEADEDSLLTITFKKVSAGTELTLTHTNIPEGQTQYEQGWLEHYFAPMKEYFKK